MARYYRGGPGFARPENALKRAEELENVGQKQAALQALHDVITSRKNRAWSKTHESIMFKHIDLCVEMKKRNQAKEALMQYRNMCQQVNINSLEEVIKYFLKKASDKADEAQKQADATTLDIEDLDEDASPEDLMLSYVSGEKSKDRTDRELVTPWFRFLWETYRSVLEILRTNPKLESLYTMTAARAFQFCQTYKRTAEFRRLCDILRQHLANMHKYREQRDISQPESLQLHLEARFEQLKVACELELWGEAFRSVEDIQGLIALGKKPPKQQTMAVYYAKLTQIFAVSDSHLYHAYSWLKLFNFSKAYNKNLIPQDLQMMACSVLLATLSILPYDRSLNAKAGDTQAEQERERILRMANILGFSVADIKRDYKTILSRGMLLATIAQMHLLGLVPAEVKQIYELLTTEFNPLELCNKVNPLLEKLEGLTQPMSAASPVKNLTLGYYVRPLKQVAILRTLKQLSDVYSTIKVSSLAALVPFATFGEVEALIVDAVKFDYLQMQIDHRQGIIYFTSQQLESDKVRNHISLFAKRLTKAVSLIEPESKVDNEEKSHELMQKWLENAEHEHKRALARKIVIEKRKEEQETALLEAEREAEKRKQQQQREAELAEERRRNEEIARREKERMEREMEEEQERRASALLEATKAKTKGGKGKDGEKLDTKQLIQEALNEKLKEQQELERKLTKMQKQMDHLERAKREEEVPYLQAAWQKQLEQDKAYHEQQQQIFLETHRKAWEADIVEKHRLVIMLEDKEVFSSQVMSRREEEFAALKAERDRQIAEKKAQRKGERIMARKTEYVRRCREELEKKVEELVEEKKKEQEDKKRREIEERQRKLDELAAKQRQREEEVERKAAEERARLLAGGAKPGAAPPTAPPTADIAPRRVAAPAASSGGGGRSSGYVPPHLRGRGSSGDGGAPPAAAPAAAAPEGPEAAAAPEAPAPVAPVREDGWRRSGGGEAERPAERAAERPVDRWSRGGSRGDSFGSSGAGAGAGGYVPPSRRNLDADRPRDDGPPRREDPPRRDDGPPRRDEEPKGGAYRPPVRRGESRW